MKKRQKKKVLKKPSAKWIAIGFFMSCLIIGSVWYNLLARSSEQEVAGATTSSSSSENISPTPPHEKTQLTCRQCRREAGSGQPASLCFHRNGVNSYANCENSEIEGETDSQTTCVFCGINKCTPHPTITGVCQEVTLQAITLSNPCNQQGNTYHSVSYTCSDGYKGQAGNSNTCIGADAWKSYVTKICHDRKKCQPTITPGDDGWCQQISATPTPKVSSSSTGATNRNKGK